MKLKLIILLFCLVCLIARAEDSCYHILPAPQSIEYGQGMLNLPDIPIISYPARLAKEAQLLGAFLQSDFQTECHLKRKKRGDILLELDTQVLPDKKEGYRKPQPTIPNTNFRTRNSIL